MAMELSPNMGDGSETVWEQTVSFWVLLVLGNLVLEQVGPTENVFRVLDFCVPPFSS